MALERVDQPMGGRAGDAGGLDDRGEGPGTALDGVDDRERPVEHADGRAWPEAGRGRSSVDVGLVTGGERRSGRPGRAFRHRRPPVGGRVGVPKFGTEFHYTEQRRRHQHRPLETGRHGATDDHPAHPRREGLGPAPRPSRRRRARPALRRPAPRPRGHQPASVRRPPVARTPRPPAGPHRRDDGPQRPHHRRSGHRRGERAPDGSPAPQRRGVRRSRSTRGARPARGSCT